MDIRYFKLISGEDILAQVEELDESSTSICLIKPFLVSIQRTGGYHQFTAHRWNLFISEKYEDRVHLQKNAIMFSGDPNEYFFEMYEEWLKPERTYKLHQDEEDLEEIKDLMEELHEEYLKKVH